MGKPLLKRTFNKAEREEFIHRVAAETALLEEYCHNDMLSESKLESGFELEMFLLNTDFQPDSNNQEFIDQINDKHLTTEIVTSSFEINSSPKPLQEHVFKHHHNEFTAIINKCSQQAKKNQQHIIAVGTLPTGKQRNYTKETISPANRYYAMDDYVALLRHYEIPYLTLEGNETLQFSADTIGLVGALASFQIHFRIPMHQSARLYNASVALSAAMVGISANSPFIMGKNIWQESRIPFYEAVTSTDRKTDKLPRVMFGTGYVENSLLDLFKENMIYYPPYVPQLMDTPAEELAHLSLNNGTIYRWNRPVVDFDSQGKPHFRVEFRPLSSGTSIIDMIADAAFYFGITYYYTNCPIPIEENLSFEQANFNFYEAAKKGLSADVYWGNNKKVNLSWLILNVLLPQAKIGLQQLGIDDSDSKYYLAIIEERVAKNRTGSQWQMAFHVRHNQNFHDLVETYIQLQQSGKPVHSWPYA